MIINTFFAIGILIKIHILELKHDPTTVSEINLLNYFSRTKFMESEEDLNGIKPDLMSVYGTFHHYTENTEHITPLLITKHVISFLLIFHSLHHQ